MQKMTDLIKRFSKTFKLFISTSRTNKIRYNRISVSIDPPTINHFFTFRRKNDKIKFLTSKNLRTIDPC